MSQQPPGPADLVLTGRFELGERQRYRHVPFEMPSDVTQIHIAYDYSDRIAHTPGLSGGNTLDIGLFDQRGYAAGTPGFRGWSGSDKSSFTVGWDWATPPYRPGAIEPGTWYVLLGPYKIGPNGLDYRVQIWLNPGLGNDFPEPTEITPGAPAKVPAAAEPGWLRGDFHCHTLFSDGDSWPAEVVAAAADIGLDFVAITDHNSARRPQFDCAPDARPIVISGTETTTYGGHWNAWGVDRWFEFRTPTTEGTQAAFDDAVAAGALVSINHPKPLGPDWEYGDLSGNHAIEIWNGPWGALNAIALGNWEERLKAGMRPVAIGGSDTHALKSPRDRLFHAHLGCPTTWVNVNGDASATGILNAVRRGGAFISASPDGPQLYFERQRDVVRIHVVGAKRATLAVLSERWSEAAFSIPENDWETQMPYPASANYLRAQVIDSSGNMMAVSNPIWRDQSSQRSDNGGN